MKRIALALFAMLCSVGAFAAPQQCICVGPAGCTVVTDPFPQGVPQPTACTLRAANGVAIATAPVVDSATIPLSNANVCAPASPTYVPGPAGSVACAVPAGSYAVGNTLTFLMSATYPNGESGNSVPFQLVNVSVLPQPTKTIPLNQRLALLSEMFSAPDEDDVYGIPDSNPIWPKG